MSDQSPVPTASKSERSPWAWVPTVNFLQGMQYILITQMFIIVFTTMGVPNSTSLFWLGLLGLPWTIKPLWGPLVDRYWTKRNWTTTMQLIIGVAFLVSAATILFPDSPMGQIELPQFMALTLVVLLVAAFASATHDIACDGYYMLALTERQQAYFVGFRSTAFRIGWIFTLGPLIYVADFVQTATGTDPQLVQIQAVVPGSAPPELRAVEAPSATSGKQSVIAPPVVAVDAGSSSTMTVRLSQSPEPDETVTVTFRVSENVPEVTIDPSFARFTSENWQNGATVLVKVDAKLKQSALAEYRVTGGNVPLSWAAVLLVAGLIYFVLAGYHRFAMPLAKADAVETANRPPFWIPALAVAATVLVPFIIGYTLYRVGLGHQEDLGPKLFPGLATDPAQKKLYDLLYKLLCLLVPTGLGALLLFAPGLKDATYRFFKKMSDISQIGFIDVFETFFAKERIGIILSFLLLYRLGEIPLSALKAPFLLAPLEQGGLNLSLTEFAFANSVVYVVALILGGLLSGWLIANFGLKKIIWILVAFMHLPNLGYVYMAYFQPSSLVIINGLLGFEAFGYGIGLAAFLMVMIMSANGPYKTAHYALCTGFMALGAMLPQLPTGFLQEILGYKAMFNLVMLLVVPGCLLIPFLPIDPNFGMKKNEEAAS
jgi:PAT family beta-lactamase induction signal transducer AmpG